MPVGVLFIAFIAIYRRIIQTLAIVPLLTQAHTTSSDRHRLPLSKRNTNTLLYFSRCCAGGTPSKPLTENLTTREHRENVPLPQKPSIALRHRMWREE
jgi:hypothetical protein